MKVKAAVLLIATVAADQLTKLVLPKIFNLSVTANPGLPFFGHQLPGFFDWSLYLLLLIAFVFLYWRFLRASDPGRLALGLILGGAVSNLIDRLARGAVIDFLDIGIASLNLADVAIWVGIAVLGYNIFRKSSNDKA